MNGVDFVKDIAAGITNFFGGRSGSYEGELYDFSYYYRLMKLNK